LTFAQAHLTARKAARIWREAAVARWQVADVKGRMLVNALWAEAGSRNRFAVPPRLDGEASFALAFRRLGTLGGTWAVSERDVYEEVN
jgi:hypothetical protein